MSGRHAAVSLVTMPYSSLSRPSLALGLLKGVLEEQGIATTVEYANLWMAEAVGIPLYHLCSHQCPTEFLAGEWTFAEAAFLGQQPDDEGYLARVCRCHASVRGYRGGDGGKRLRDHLISLRRAATLFIGEAAERILECRPQIVGCTSTFEQHVASLALLRRIRQLDPSVITIMGGANCESEMGETTHRCFPWIDYVVSGEADGIMVPLVRLALEQGRSLSGVELPFGVFGPQHRLQLPVMNGNGGSDGRAPRAVFREMDRLPLPHFSDYFDQLRGLSLKDAIIPALPLETSRGCWWGAVHHCTFCGLNGTGMTYRSKAPERVLDELRTLEAEYGVRSFESVDNIMDHKYFQALLPALAQDMQRRRIFYEVKSNLNRTQVKSLKSAGITWVQPGIESLHSDVLHLMDKGVQGWQNLQLLKWAREFGLRLSWSILWGFPGEQEDWYWQMAEWIPALEHLQAPAGVHRLRYDRFSVYHKQAAEMGLHLSPISAMRFVYPLTEAELRRLSYFFVEEADLDSFQWLYGRRRAGVLQPGYSALFKTVDTWKMNFKRKLTPILSMVDNGDELEVLDTRSVATEFRVVLRGLLRAVCLACNTAPLRHRLANILAEQFEMEASHDEIEDTVQELIARRFLLAIDDRLVTLAVEGTLPPLPELDEFPGGYVRALPATAQQRAYLAPAGVN
jgi:ribosomal peptide maturation radical SAM protein 1